MLRYGSDRPDRRIGRDIHDLGGAFAQSEFKVFSSALESGGVVRGLKTGGGEFPRKRFDDLTERAKSMGAKGLVWAVVEPDGWRSPVAKFLSDDEIKAASEALAAGEGDVVLLVADEPLLSAEVLGELRRRLGDRLGLIDQDANALTWIVDWPLLGGAADEERWDPHTPPFPSPDGEFDPDDPGAARAKAYDVVWNGWEIGGGWRLLRDPHVQPPGLSGIGAW